MFPLILNVTEGNGFSGTKIVAKGVTQKAYKNENT